MSVQVRWRCPHCGTRYLWTWPDYDKPRHGYRITMYCQDCCKSQTPMICTGLQDGGYYGFRQTSEDK